MATQAARPEGWTHEWVDHGHGDPDHRPQVLQVARQRDDLQGPAHLKNILEVCQGNTYTRKHWLPTREYKLPAIHGS